MQLCQSVSIKLNLDIDAVFSLVTFLCNHFFYDYIVIHISNVSGLDVLRCCIQSHCSIINKSINKWESKSKKGGGR